MKIKSLAYSKSELEDNLRENIELHEDSEELESAMENLIEEPSLNDIELYYVDANTGTRSGADQPTGLTANDGTSMLTGVIGIDGVETPEQIDDLVGQGLLDKVVEFINRDPRINIDVDSLITDKIHNGFISFVISPTLAESKKRVITSQKEDSNKVEKVCKDFFCKFNIGKDLSDFNINAANEELFNLLEKVAVNLNALEKRKVMRTIKKKLAEHNVKLIYIEQNLS